MSQGQGGMVWGTTWGFGGQQKEPGAAGAHILQAVEHAGDDSGPQAEPLPAASDPRLSFLQGYRTEAPSAKQQPWAPAPQPHPRSSSGCSGPSCSWPPPCVLSTQVGLRVPHSAGGAWGPGGEMGSQGEAQS